MKKYILVSALAAALFGLSACNDEFLDVSPKGAVTDATAFGSYESCYDYMLGLYDVFNG